MPRHTFWSVPAMPEKNKKIKKNKISKKIKIFFFIFTLRILRGTTYANLSFADYLRKFSKFLGFFGQNFLCPNCVPHVFASVPDAFAVVPDTFAVVPAKP